MHVTKILALLSAIGGALARQAAPQTDLPATAPSAAIMPDGSINYCALGHGFMCSTENDADLMYCRKDGKTVVYAGSCPQKCISAPNGVADSCGGSHAAFLLKTTWEGRFCGKDVHMAQNRVYFYMDSIGVDLGPCRYGCAPEENGIPAHCASRPRSRAPGKVLVAAVPPVVAVAPTVVATPAPSPQIAPAATETVASPTAPATPVAPMAMKAPGVEAIATPDASVPAQTPTPTPTAIAATPTPKAKKSRRRRRRPTHAPTPANVAVAPVPTV